MLKINYNFHVIFFNKPDITMKNITKLLIALPLRQVYFVGSNTEIIEDVNNLIKFPYK